MEDLKELVLFHIEECTIRDEFDGEPTIDKDKLINQLATMIERREKAIFRKYKIKRDDND